MSCRPLVLTLAVVVALALAPPASADPFIYYGSNNGSGVWRADIDGSSPTNIITGGEFAPAMAVDREHIFFKSLSTAISRADIDGSNLNSNFITLPSNATTIKEIEANATHVFWTDDFNNAIGRARIAGPCTVGAAPPCDIEPAWIGAGAAGTGDGGISGLAIDGTHVYWTRVVAGTIARANLDGSSRNTSFITGINGPQTQAPFDVDVNGTHIYWGDSPGKVIGRAELNGSGPPSNLERSYVSTSPSEITTVEANGTHVFWASDGGTIGRARTAGTCTVGLAPPCDTNNSFIGGGNQLRGLELGVEPVDVVVTDCDDPALATLTEVTGDLIVQNVAGCDGLSLPNLTEVGGDVVITGNTEATAIDLAALTTVRGDLTISDNPAATTIDLGSLVSDIEDLEISGNTAATAIDIGSVVSDIEDIDITGNTAATVIDAGSLVSVSGSVDISGNAEVGSIDAAALTTVSGNVDISGNSSDTVVDASSLTSVSGNADLETAGTTVDVSELGVGGDLTLTGNGSDSVSAATAGGVTDVSVLGGSAAMNVVLPDGAFALPVAFTIERQGDEPAQAGTTATGAAAQIDPVAGYRFTFDVPTLNQDAQLAFTVALAQLDPATRAALLAGVADGSATLGVRGDGQGASYQAFSRCTAGQTPAQDACVGAVLLAANGQPAAPGTAPAFVRFDGVAGHFSAYSVVLAKSAAAAPPGATGTAPSGAGGGGGGGGGAIPSRPAVRGPGLRALALKPRTFTAARSGASVLASKKAGTKIGYRLSRPATLKFTVERAKGRPRKLKGSFRHKGRQGANSFRFSGRVRGRSLKPGRYKLVAVATDATGTKSKASRTAFRIFTR